MSESFRAPGTKASSNGNHALIPSLHDILNPNINADDFVAKYSDIAAINLACARGLPSADENEFIDYLELLDAIADAVRQETDRSWRLFKLKPSQFNNSEAVFRLYTMEHVFRVRFKIAYDPLVHKATEGGKTWTTVDSTEIFINGILSAKRTGTCSSLPTFAIAVGRRLGYPLKLALAPNHTFYRWDDGSEIINLQHTEAGGEVRPTEYFHQWPRKWTEIDYAINERTRVWLHSMTPRQEASKFLCNRAILLRDTGRCREAMEAVNAAERFNPVNPACDEIRFSIFQQEQHQNSVPSVSSSGTPINLGTLEACMASEDEFTFGPMAILASDEPIDVEMAFDPRKIAQTNGKQ
jgi:hypothetical protein